MVIDHDSIAHEHKVQVGVRESGKVQILEGIALGQRIVVAGGFGLHDGSHVRVEKPAKPGEPGASKTDGGKPGAQ